MSLKNIWKNIQFKLDASDLMDPSERVQKEMEKEGWSFKLKTDFTAVSMYSPVSYAYIMPVSPEGKEALGAGNKDTYEQYCDARRKAAAKIHGVK